MGEDAETTGDGVLTHTAFEVVLSQLLQQTYCEAAVKMKISGIKTKMSMSTPLDAAHLMLDLLTRQRKTASGTAAPTASALVSVDAQTAHVGLKGIRNMRSTIRSTSKAPPLVRSSSLCKSSALLFNSRCVAPVVQHMMNSLVRSLGALEKQNNQGQQPQEAEAAVDEDTAREYITRQLGMIVAAGGVTVERRT